MMYYLEPDADAPAGISFILSFEDYTKKKLQREVEFYFPKKAKIVYSEKYTEKDILSGFYMAKDNMRNDKELIKDIFGDFK